jgi:hypothetical protein
MSKMKWFGGFVIILVLMLTGGVSSYAQAGYSDVNDDHWAKEAIEYLNDWSIINGYPDGSFKPNGQLKRVHVALMMDRFKNYSWEEFEDQNLSDVPINDPNYHVIQAEVANGLFDDVIKNNKFEPYKVITRAEMASVLVKVFELEGSSSIKVSDVAANHWAYPYVQALLDNNMTNLYEGNQFKPDSPLTRAQFVTFMARGMNDYFKSGSKEIEGSDFLFVSTYDGVLKIATDTNQSVTLHPKAAYEEMYHKDGWIYFMEETFRTDRMGDAVKGFIYRMKEDGSSKEKLSEDVVVDFAVQGNKIVYSYYGKFGKTDGYSGVIGEDMLIKSMNLDGSDNKVLLDNKRTFTMISNSDWVFYVDNESGSLYKVKGDGSQLAKVSNEPFDYYENFLKVSDEHVLFSSSDYAGDNYTHAIYLLNKDGLNKQKVSDENFFVKDIVDNKIIYQTYDYETGNESYFVSNLDFTNPILITDEFQGQYLGASNGEIWFYNYGDGSITSISY